MALSVTAERDEEEPMTETRELRAYIRAKFSDSEVEEQGMERAGC
jgi:hypothetical protein